MEEEKIESDQTQPEAQGSGEPPAPGPPPDPGAAEERELESQVALDQPPEVDQVQAVPPAPSPEVDQVQAVPPAPPPEGRFRRGFRLAIRWSAGLLLVFALGFLTATLGLYLPISREVVREGDRVNRANTRIEELEADIEALNLELDAAANNQEIQQEALDSANLHTLILSALVDVTEARLALVGGDIESANLALTNSPETFQSIAALVEADQADAVGAMQQRLELALSVLEEDTPAALSDLEVIANNLVKLENTYFVVP